jgi:hypothetical protein
MRSSLKLALIASSALVLASTQAFAQDGPAAAPPAAAAPAPATPAATVEAAPVVAPPAAATPAPAPAAPVVVAVPAGAAVEVATTAAPSTDGTILVHIDTPQTVSLERRSGPSAAWEHVCESPCDGRLPVGDQYRIVGTGMNASNAFTLDGSKGDRAVLIVAPGTKTKANIGTGLLIGGAVVLVGSVIVGLVGACPSCTFQSGSGGATNTTNTDVIGATTGLAVAGLATGIFGAAWLVDNQHSRVSGAIQAAPPSRGGLDPAHVSAGLRAPMPSMQSFSVPVLRF